MIETIIDRGFPVAFVSDNLRGDTEGAFGCSACEDNGMPDTLHSVWFVGSERTIECSVCGTVVEGA